MRAAVVEAAGHLVVRDVPMPEPGPYEALVRIEACSICNSTDTKIIDRHFVSQIPLPLVLGHESVGTVLQVGERVAHLHPGDRVLRPGARYAPAVGLASAWGGFAEYGLVTDGLAWNEEHPGQKPSAAGAAQQIVPGEIEPAAATAIITLKETLDAARAAGINGQTRTAIIGTGPVARSFTYWARYLGAPWLVVFGRRPQWCDDLLKLGADCYVAAGQVCGSTAASPADLANFDCVIEAVGSTEALEQALALLAPGGHVGNYGVAPENDVRVPAVMQARQEGRIVDLPVHEEHVHDEMLALVRQGKVDLNQWISHRLPLDEIHEGLRLVRNKEALKVVIEL